MDFSISGALGRFCGEKKKTRQDIENDVLPQGPENEAFTVKICHLKLLPNYLPMLSFFFFFFFFLIRVDSVYSP